MLLRGILWTIEVKESIAMTSRCFRYSKLLVQHMATSPNFVCDILSHKMWITLVIIHNVSTILTPKWQLMYVGRNIKARPRNHYCRGQAIKQYILRILTVCFVAFIISTQRTLLSPATCLPVTYFSTLPHKKTDFQKKRYWT